MAYSSSSKGGSGVSRVAAMSQSRLADALTKRAARSSSFGVNLGARETTTPAKQADATERASVRVPGQPPLGARRSCISTARYCWAHSRPASEVACSSQMGWASALPVPPADDGNGRFTQSPFDGSGRTLERRCACHPIRAVRIGSRDGVKVATASPRATPETAPRPFCSGTSKARTRLRESAERTSRPRSVQPEA